MNIEEMRDAKYREVAALREALERVMLEAKELDTLIELGKKHNVELRTAGDVAKKLINTVITRSHSTEKSLKARVIETAQLILADGKRRLSRELIVELEKMGVHLLSRDPIGTLASYLSREKQIFVSEVKAGGWTLVPLAKKAKADNAPTLSAFLFNGSQGQPTQQVTL